MALPEGIGAGGVVKTGTQFQHGVAFPVYAAPAKATDLYAKKPGAANSSNPRSATGAEGLAGARFLTQMYQKATGPLINPPLHPMSETTFFEGRDRISLQRGMIRRLAHRGAVGHSDIALKDAYKFRFLYNPAEIAINNTVFAGMVPSDYQNQMDPARARFPGQEQLSFSLFLDRTQEVYQEGLAARGTQVDIDALYRVINGNSTNPGFLTLSAVEIHWGPTTQNGKPLPPYLGFITNVSITHVKFTPRMAPMRSIIQLGVTRLVGARTLQETTNTNVSAGLKEPS